jgi:hypothetical protein
MALIRTGTGYVFGPKGAGAGAPGAGVISTSTNRRYGSENEVVGGDGEILDIIYSGAEEGITEVSTGAAATLNTGDIGTGSATAGVVIRRKIDLSNEDMAREEVEKIKFTL